MGGAGEGAAGLGGSHQPAGAVLCRGDGRPFPQAGGPGNIQRLKLIMLIFLRSGFVSGLTVWLGAF